VDVHVGSPLLDRPGEVEVGGAGQVGVGAALHAHLGGARLPRLRRPVGDLLQGEGVGVGVGAPLREGAEPAAGVADVGEVDVAGDDEGDVVADGVAADPVGQVRERLQFRAVRVQQGQGLVVGEGGGVVLGAAQRGADLRVEPAGRPGAELGPGDALTQFGPVPVDGVEVAAPVAAAALGVHLHVQFGAARGGQASLG